ncbi:MmgE/PrpD family protein [Pseudomonas sp. PDM13]|uniref:MmgE/PrpD family protein n=1 Tax=Pseudomonas sp. PDM13 TaxID=2769255 RepID=UPI0021E08413|nr:MmgE/PrpD family protein [Pseudomonas sp. PDM13]MCU9951047.1 MmgE/PrpD family protein [Pseudomonas sp. PDM13]
MNHTQKLAAFLADLHSEQLPAAVLERTEELFLDWLGSALAAEGAHPVPLFERFAARMGPAGGPSRILVNGRGTSAWFAALVNAASSHLMELDDLHNGSVLHPGTVVFPAALAAAQDLGRSGHELLLAAVAGYEAGIRIGECLGRSHYRLFHTTATVGTLAAAVAVGKLLGLDREGFLRVLGSAGTQAAGLWAFLRDTTDSKQLHAAKAAADGLLSAYLVGEGLDGARDVLEGAGGLAAVMSVDAEPVRLSDRLGTRWALLETSIKVHACCRHTHPTADALLALMAREGLGFEAIDRIDARVHQDAIDMLGRVGTPATVHQAKFSMGRVLGLVAVHGRAGLEEFRRWSLDDPRVLAIADKVHLQQDSEVDSAYPQRWLGRVQVRTTDGRLLYGAADAARGDPENPLSRVELEDRFREMLAFAGTRTATEADALIDWVWRLRASRELDGPMG